jgi:RNA polymerase sigma-70 factor (ECF subfamily)
VARDLTADVFQRLLQAVQNGTGPQRSVKAWLFRTAHNIVVDYYRRQQFRDHEPLPQNIAAAAEGPDETAAARIMAGTVRQALRTLTPEQRQVISLKYLDGLSNTEVAKILGKSTGAVKSLQHRALAALQRVLAANEAFPQAAIEKGMDPGGAIPKEQSLSTAS